MRKPYNGVVGVAGREGDVVGDASPGTLANTWTESTRLHRDFVDIVRECWTACQKAPDRVRRGVCCESVFCDPFIPKIYVLFNSIKLAAARSKFVQASPCLTVTTTV